MSFDYDWKFFEKLIFVFIFPSSEMSQPQPTRPWLPRSRSDVTHLLGCLHCPAVYCFGYGQVQTVDSQFTVAPAIFVVNMVASDLGLCWCRCGNFVGLRHRNYVILHRYRSIVPSPLHASSAGFSEWINDRRSINMSMWACRDCSRIIGLGDIFATHVVDPLFWSMHVLIWLIHRLYVVFVVVI